jgi:hypothetical protein
MEYYTIFSLVRVVSRYHAGVMASVSEGVFLVPARCAASSRGGVWEEKPKKEYIVY